MAQQAQLNFVRQQGFQKAQLGSCGFQYSSLMWQPRLTAVVVAGGLIFQWAPIFLAMSAILWWNAALPSLNLFDAIYNVWIASPPTRPKLTRAPAPRRFSQGMGATFMLGIGISLLMGWRTAGYVFEGFTVIALSSLIWGKFCMGSYVFYLLTGQAGYAKRTLPWANPE